MIINQVDDVKTHTGKIPRLALVKINLRDDFKIDFSAIDLSLEVVGYELFIGGVESETGRQRNWRHFPLIISFPLELLIKYS